jgi:hypothetical protein
MAGAFLIIGGIIVVLGPGGLIIWLILGVLDEIFKKPPYEPPYRPSKEDACLKYLREVTQSPNYKKMNEQIALFEAWRRERDSGSTTMDCHTYMRSKGFEPI